MRQALSEDKLEEETYSLIFTSLKHPLRRKILRMLTDKPLSFSEILEQFTIDRGHLNYHLENLGDLLIRTEDGKYALSSVGLAAIKLMSKVEEQEETAKTNKRTRTMSKTAMIFSAVFAVALLTASVYALAYTSQNQAVLFEASPEIENISIRIPPNQVFSYSIALNTDSSNNGYSYSIGQNEASINISPPTNSIVQWTRYFSDTRLQLSGSFSVMVTVYDQNGGIVSQARKNGDISSQINKVVSFEFSKFGTYTLQIMNLKAEAFSATIVPHVTCIEYSKPLFSYGIVSLAILLLYPLLLLINYALPRKRR